MFISHRVPYPPNKGEKIRTFNQIEQLSSLGHNVHLFSPLDKPQERIYFTELASSVCASVNYAKLIMKPARFLFGLLKRRPLSVSNFYSQELQLQIDRFLSEQKVDALVCSASSVAEYVFKSRVITGLQYPPLLIMDFMDVDSDKWSQYERQSSFPMKLVYSRESQLLNQYEKRIVNSFDACFLIAEAESELFKNKVVDSDKVHVMGNGLDTAAFYPAPAGVQNESPVFIFTGVMDYKPNIDAVLWFVDNCWAEIHRKHPNAEFIIGGMNPVAEIKCLDSRDGIIVTGFVEDMLPFFHKADIFVAPFRIARGVQNKVLQAFACGLAVVSTPMGAEGIQCENETDILLASRPNEFIDQIDRLVTESGLKQRLVKNALSLIEEHYSWSSQVSPLTNMLMEEEGCDEIIS